MEVINFGNIKLSEYDEMDEGNGTELTSILEICTFCLSVNL